MRPLYVEIGGSIYGEGGYASPKRCYGHVHLNVGPSG